ncbi:unnamed protein product, partial [Lampetra fluviatilis]
LLTVSEEVRSRCGLKHRKSLVVMENSLDTVAMDTFSSPIMDPVSGTVRGGGCGGGGGGGDSQTWMSPKASMRNLIAIYPAVGQISPRARKSMSLDMGQPSQANSKKMLGSRKSFDHLLSDNNSSSSSSSCCKPHKRQDSDTTSGTVTTPPKMRKVGEPHFKPDAHCVSQHLRKMSTSEANVLLDEEVLTDTHCQALLLTVLATLVKYTQDEFEQRVLYEYLAEASLVFPRVFPVVHTLLDSKITMLLSVCPDPRLLGPVHSIVQSVVHNEESPPHHQPSYLQSFGFGGLWRFAGPFSK